MPTGDKYPKDNYTEGLGGAASCASRLELGGR